jgi:hypothetical protein
MYKCTNVRIPISGDQVPPAGGGSYPLRVGSRSYGVLEEPYDSRAGSSCGPFDQCRETGLRASPIFFCQQAILDPSIFLHRGWVPTSPLGERILARDWAHHPRFLLKPRYQLPIGISVGISDQPRPTNTVDSCHNLIPLHGLLSRHQQLRGILVMSSQAICPKGADKVSPTFSLEEYAVRQSKRGRYLEKYCFGIRGLRY